MSAKWRDKSGQGATTQRACDVCGEEYKASERELRREWGRTCSKVCAGLLKADALVAAMRDKIDDESRRKQMAKQRKRYYAQVARLRRRVRGESKKQLRREYKARGVPLPTPDSVLMGMDRSRARKAGIEYEPISRAVVFKRDGYRCRICGKRTRDDVRRYHPDKAVLGHVVAVSRGGSHTYDNVVCLCWSCNNHDSTGRLPIQMHLSVSPHFS